MPHASLFRTRWQRMGATLSLWTLIGLIDGAHFYVVANSGRPIVSWDEALASGLTDWYLWALLAPFVFLLGSHYPLDRANWVGRAGLYLVAFGAVATLKASADAYFRWLIHGRNQALCPPGGDQALADVYRTYFVQVIKGKFFLYLLIYASILAVTQGLLYYRKYRERELSASRLEAQLAQAQLQSLKMQLHPHFLFNTLNAISALLHTDVELADRMIARLGDLLRATLDHDGEHEITLREELEFLRPYLEIEQARLGPRLTVRTEIDPEALDGRVPYLALQPLVENAIRHGIAARSRPGRLCIRVRREGELLCVRVEDDGPGLPPEPPAGIGLANTRARLQALYGPAHEFTVRNGPSGGAEVTVRLPFRREPPADEGGRGDHPHADRG